MYLVFDTETSGLPQGRDPKQPSHFATARLVSISWIVLDDGFEAISKDTRLVYPSDFVISPGSVAIHGISQAYALQNGEHVDGVLEAFHTALAQCHTLVAHNISFDVGVVLNECYRLSRNDIVKKIVGCAKYCTMARGKDLLHLKKSPKLAELHEALYGESITNAHNAEFDTHYCARCFQALKKVAKKRATPEPELSLTDEQLAIVRAAPNVTTLVLACAGSGKTTTIMHRIKHLLQEVGVDDSAIMLTTFTRDASSEMERKLEALLDGQHNIAVGTFDSLALRYLKMHNPRVLEAKTVNVSQFAPLFLAYLKTPDGKSLAKQFKYLFVDEFQDINDVQYEIIREFTKNGVILTAVGDDAQNIYSFRGSNIKYTLRFTSLFPGSTMTKLTTNFRSTPEIVAVANASIERNEAQIPKVMRAARGLSGPKPTVQYFDTAAAQMEFVKEQVQEIRRSKRIKLCQVAIMCPQNVFLFQLEEVFTKADIPHVLLDGSGEVRTSQKDDHVCLTTIHKAKGLEWDTVFLVMMNDYVFPSRKTPDDVVESRRLFYVAATRPKTTFYLTFCPVKDAPTISRFVSEIEADLLDFKNTKPECFGARDSTRPQPLRTSVSKFAKHNVHAMKDIPTPRRVPLSVHHYTYPSFVQKNGLHKEFDVFLGALVCRMASQHRLVPFHFEPAVQVVGSIKLSFPEYVVYQRHRQALTRNIDVVGELCVDFYNNASRIIKTIATPQQSIAGEDVSIVLGIVRKLYKQAVKLGVSIERVAIFTDRFLPEGFEESIKAALARANDNVLPWQDVLTDLWELSKCHHIVHDQRRRLLYMSTPDLSEAMCMYRHLEEMMLGWAATATEVCTHPHVTGTMPDGTGIHGAADLCMGETLINVRCSTDNKPRAEHIMELKLISQMMRDKIEHLVIINPLNCCSYELKSQEVASAFDIASQ